jgi:hypothetical protein
MGEAMKRFAFFVFCAVVIFFNTGFSQTPDSSNAAGTTAAPANDAKDGSDEVTVPGKQPSAPASQQQENKPAAASEKPAEQPAPVADKPAEKPADKTPAPSSAEAPEKPSYELSAGSVTVNGQQWTRIAFGVDLPLWKFGVFFDLEAFLDQQGNFSNKGWDFKNDPYDAVMRKIRYVRFGHENDPLFVKVGGLSDVTIGHGFIVDHFTNMLHYPDQKLLGAQVYINDVTPIGLTVQAMSADLQEFRGKYDGGVGALRLAVKPLKMLSLPLLSNLSIGGTYAVDRNMYAPARDWQPSEDQRRALMDSMILTPAQKQQYRDSGLYNDSALSQIEKENAVKGLVKSFGIYGIDLNLPIITTSLLSLDLYAQSGMRDDSVPGWGFGAPGVALKLWRLNAQVEYRHTQGRFAPGFFDQYYLDERLTRSPTIETKAAMLQDDTLNGVFGALGFDIANVLVVNGSYQFMKGKTDEQKDQRFELTGNIGQAVLGRIPKIRKLEAYIYKTNVGSDIVKYDSTGTPVVTNGKFTYDGFFEKTPFMYYGYRVGFEISPGATLICDTRFGFTRDNSGALVPNNNVCVQTAFTF